jgi:hypothetical protein
METLPSQTRHCERIEHSFYLGTEISAGFSFDQVLFGKFVKYKKKVLK